MQCSSVVFVLVLGLPVLSAHAADPLADQRERDGRKLLEQSGAPPQANVNPPAAAAGPVADYQTPAQAVAAHNWSSQSSLAGPVSNGLSLSLGAVDDALVYGPPRYLYVELKNQQPAQRVLDAIPACGSLGRADILTFRVRSDDGSELVVGNGYVDRESVHEHPPLSIGANGSLQAAVNLNDLIGGSGALFDLYQRSKSLMITAEVPPLALHSNTVTIPIAGR